MGLKSLMFKKKIAAKLFLLPLSRICQLKKLMLPSLSPIHCGGWGWIRV